MSEKMSTLLPLGMSYFRAELAWWPSSDVPPAATPPPPLSLVCFPLRCKFMETCSGKEEAQGQILPSHTKYRALSFLSRGGYSGKENSKSSTSAPIFPSRSQGAVLFQCAGDIRECTMSRWELGLPQPCQGRFWLCMCHGWISAGS